MTPIRLLLPALALSLAGCCTATCTCVCSGSGNVTGSGCALTCGIAEDEAIVQADEKCVDELGNCNCAFTTTFLCTSATLIATGPIADSGIGEQTIDEKDRCLVSEASADSFRTSQEESHLKLRSILVANNGGDR